MNEALTEVAMNKGETEEPQAEPAVELTEEEKAVEREQMLTAKARELAAIVVKIEDTNRELELIDSERKETKKYIDKLQADIMELGNEIKNIELGNYQRKLNFPDNKKENDEEEKPEDEKLPEYLENSENYETCLQHFRNKNKNGGGITKKSLAMCLYGTGVKKEGVEKAKVYLEWFNKIGELDLTVAVNPDTQKEKIVYFPALKSESAKEEK